MSPAQPVVTMRVPAHVDYVSTLRVTSASLAARCDLTVDEIEDLRLAVDEACALLLRATNHGTAIDARFELTPGCLAVEVSAPNSHDAAAPDRGGLAWAVLSALATSVDVHTRDGALVITVTKRRETSGP